MVARIIMSYEFIQKDAIYFYIAGKELLTKLNVNPGITLTPNYGDVNLIITVTIK